MHMFSKIGQEQMLATSKLEFSYNSNLKSWVQWAISICWNPKWPHVAIKRIFSVPLLLNRNMCSSFWSSLKYFLLCVFASFNPIFWMLAWAQVDYFYRFSSGPLVIIGWLSCLVKKFIRKLILITDFVSGRWSYLCSC